MKTSKQLCEHYTWGQNCDGWFLLRNDSLSVIQEKMPPGTEETLHFHLKAQQFFYILSGLASFEIEGAVTELKPNEGIHVAPNQKHKIKNTGFEDLHFLVISQPKSNGDRVNHIP